ncbi:MAG: bifunctional folylpolyglutamate synthase/dihydrofolate synthase [Candidatus Nanopelagicales bacterium]|nr:bifunctional folylpolyglutamate synthase/dihydrofolate synthase [Candidatus Nanopelagicales bacterium]MCH9678246.1 bifunctional folylpolyglutamate synthase/dihydrofolate synthase [Actinomycetes bacterium]MCH9787631.1 bifunctional folylpolyglutamate synthase/dihydrofolate synthase [Actinomycetes bacterium]MCH9796634.1 bifunctional folylpolyglutamate synthase/dihydrofolate synthase [Actinomycetes bacterium]MCH9851351.1 bifunctional folylpolyglutamate synthase/dihydrofolate synthase [Actinomyce
MDLPQLWAELESRWPESIIDPSLTRIVSVMELLGDPQRAYPVIQVAGTNGKTSTARMIESILRAYGLRTGLFTSPHLVDARERIRLDGEPVTAERLVDTWNDIEPYVRLVDKNSTDAGGVPLSYFEVFTSLAYAAFADAPVDVAVIEVGMGGTWDATSVAAASVAVITPIGMDHAEYLGDTIEQIAGEKAGIIAPGCTAVTSCQTDDARSVVVTRASELDVPLKIETEDFGLLSRDVAVGGQLVSMRGLRGEYDEVFVPFFGEHQASNACLALAAVEAFLGSGDEALDVDIVREGFASADSSGRLHAVRLDPTVLVDSAHNPHGARALAAAIHDSFTFDRLIGVVGLLSDKDAHGVLEALEPVLDELIVTTPASPRALPADDLAAVAENYFSGKDVVVEDELLDAVDRAMGIADADGDVGGSGVLVTGSVVLVGDVLRLFAREMRRPDMPDAADDDRMD